MAEQGQERTEKPTPFKLKEARKKGQVSKSMEVNSLFMLAGVLFLAYMLSEKLIVEQLTLSKNILEFNAQAISEPEGILVLLDRIRSSMLDIYWPLIGVIILISVVGNLVQTGPIFSFFPLKPDAKRLNPIAGFKRIFSKRMLYESFKSFIKLAAFALVGYWVIASMLFTLMNLVDISPDVYPMALVDMSRELVAKLLLVVLLTALIDILYTRWDFMKQMRMSHKDIKDEVKRREGDPLIRAKRRELQKEALEKSKSLANVPDADVLITNPTHLAIALKFDREKMVAPEIIAKGSGEMAQKMKEVARKHRVPLVENKPLARSMYNKVKVNSVIPEETYPKVAKIYAWLSSKSQVNMNQRAY